MEFKQNSSGGRFLPGLIGMDRDLPEMQSRKLPGSFPLGRPVTREDAKPATPAHQLQVLRPESCRRAPRTQRPVAYAFHVAGAHA